MVKEAIWNNYFEVARAAQQCGDFHTAATMFQEAINLAQGPYPGDGLSLHLQALSFHGLALALLEGGASEQCALAEHYLRKAIRLYPLEARVDTRSFVAAVLCLADIYYHSRFPERALPLLKKAVKIVTAQDGLHAPQLVQLFKRMAIIYSDNRYFAKAEKFVRQASALA
jgi:tetratricopeptide (TPR) repeat protein